MRSSPEPMRPVSVPHDEWPTTPAWKMPVLITVSAVAAAATLALSTPMSKYSVWAVALIAATSLVVASTVRVHRENSGRRISWLRGPEVRRRDVDLLQGAGGAAFVVSIFAVHGTPNYLWLFLLSIGTWLVPPLILQAIHNHRVR